MTNRVRRPGGRSQRYQGHTTCAPARIEFLPCDDEVGLPDRTHGIGRRVRKFFESWGYQAEIIELFDEGLREGESLVVVLASFGGRARIAHLMAGNGGHAVYYFGVGHVESLTGP